MWTQSDLGPHCLPVRKNRFENFARIFSRRHRRTTFSDAGFLGALRVKEPLDTELCRDVQQRPWSDYVALLEDLDHNCSHMTWKHLFLWPSSIIHSDKSLPEIMIFFRSWVGPRTKNHGIFSGNRSNSCFTETDQTSQDHSLTVSNIT